MTSELLYAALHARSCGPLRVEGGGRLLLDAFGRRLKEGVHKLAHAVMQRYMSRLAELQGLAQD